MAPAHDLRFALRTFRKAPGFTAVIVLVLGIGIGANTAMFTLVNGILLKPLPCPEGHRIMHLGTTNVSKGITQGLVSYPDFLDWRSQARSFTDLALFGTATFNVGGGATAAEPVSGARITANGFRTLRIAPFRGRDFRPADDQPGAAPVVILGHGLWMSRYGGDLNVIGRTIRVDQAPVVVIGIMPEGMRFPAVADIWMPLVQTPELRRRDARQSEAFGRLRDGVLKEEAAAEMELVGRRLQSEYPDSNQGFRPVITPYTQRAIGNDIRLVLVSLQGAVAFLLLVVCANAANLLLSRSLARTREVAIRAALGASRFVLIRQLLTESVMYAAAGGLLGVVLAYAGVRTFDTVAPAGRPYWLTFGMDFRVFGFFALAVMVTGVVFGIAPALHSLRTGLNDSLKDGTRGVGAGKSARRLANAFVIVQLAATLILLVGIGLLGRSIVNIYGQATGFDSASVLTLRLSAPPGRYEKPGELARFHDRLLAALKRMPEVEAAAIGSHLPLGGSGMMAVETEGNPLPSDGKPAPVATVTVSPDYFRTFGIRLLAGRQFMEADGEAGRWNAIVNQRFAANYWPRQEALGKRLRMTVGQRSEWFTIVGIIADVRQNRATAKEIAPVVYVPSRAAADAGFFVALRTSVRPESVCEAVRAQIAAVDMDVPAASMMSMTEVLRLAHWPHRVFGTMFGIFGLVAAVLAGLGVYSVIAYSVTMRTREIGLRMALGATRASISAMVVSGGLRRVAPGLLLGVAGALALTRVLRSLLVQVSATDPATFALVGAFQVALALIACWVPARRAAKANPLDALREQ